MFDNIVGSVPRRCRTIASCGKQVCSTFNYFIFYFPRDKIAREQEVLVLPAGYYFVSLQIIVNIR